MIKNTEDLSDYQTWGLPLLLLMAILMVLGLIGAVIVNVAAF